MSADSPAILLHTTAARVEALRLTMKVMIATLVQSGSLPAQQFAQHLQHEAEKMVLLDDPGNEFLALAQAARDEEFGMCITIARQAGDLST